jgi:hypothetical protein
MSLSTIGAAITNAVAIGGGADVCVCDPLAAGTSTFVENVTMVEGVSVFGGLDCASWTQSNMVTTLVQDVDADGLTFPAGITAITALDHMSVTGQDDATAGAHTAAITVTDSSPTLATDVIRAGVAAIANGLRVIQAAGVASPAVTNGTYAAVGAAGGTAVAVSIEGASPHFTAVGINPFVPGSAVMATAATSYGVDCVGCAGTTFMAGTISGGGATTLANGIHGTGNVAGLTVTSTNIGGGATNAVGSTSAGVRLDTCTGAPTFTTVGANGGGNIGGLPAMTTRTGFWSTGAACAPVIDGGRYTGCEAGITCLGIDADTSSALVIRNVQPPAGGGFGIQGTTGTVDTAYGVRCRSGACASITNDVIGTGVLNRAGPRGVGLWIEGASPTVDSNRITGPSAQLAVAMGPPQFYGVYLADSSASITNNIVHDGTHALRAVSFLYDMTPVSIGLARGPVIANNTIDYNVCATCGPRIGLVLFSNSATSPTGTFRNNIIHNLTSGAVVGTTNAVVEANVNSDPRFFENNALWDPTATGGALYFDEGTTAISTAVGINLLNTPTSTYTANQVVDCLVNATFHIPMTSMCVDTGTAMSCPAADFERQSRPFPAICDIGADEFHP